MSTTSSRRKYWLAAIKIGLSAAILAYLYYRARQEDQFAELATSPKLWHWLVASFVLCVVAHLISYVRWGMLVRALGIDFPAADATRIGLIGLFFGLFAFGVVGGDSLRIYYAARQAKNRLADVFCSVFLDRAVGMLTMFTFATIGYVWIGVEIIEGAEPTRMRNVQFVCQLIAAATLIGWVVIGIFFLTPGLPNSPLVNRLRTIPRIGGILGQLSDSALLYREKTSVVLTSIGLSILVNLGFVGAIFLLACGISVQHPPLSKHFMIAPISMAANAIPLPGGIGGMESMLSYFYAAFSVKNEFGPGVVVAFAFRFMLLILAAFGAIAWFVSREQVKSLATAQEDNSMTVSKS